MTPVELTGLGTFLLMAFTAIGGAVWKWKGAVEQAAYSRADSAALLREALAAIEQAEKECSAMSERAEKAEAQLRHEVEYEQPRLHAVIFTLQQTVKSQQTMLDRITADDGS